MPSDRGDASDLSGPALDPPISSLRTPIEADESLPSFDTLSLVELQERLEQRLYPLYEARFAAGLYELTEMPVDEVVTSEDELVAVRFGPDGSTLQRTVLPEAEHPEEYALWREIRARQATQHAR